ncbi:hypothetical protein [Salinibacterium sp. SWN248]|uniref:hypothetical protein n=1 Tax=Salinibacterium sp. SWN248 TaxID=2792056 RepID=UPI0018CE3DA0|nr:hypothetical protein [Salinibacterium sp. SWN248]MBH0024973.1 hypothetical protein [Salinibacterium sp. SWN248]
MTDPSNTSPSAAPWLPAGWQHPTHVSLPTGHHLRPIRASDTQLDMDAVRGSRERLWSIYGEAWGWPPATMTAEQDRADLQRHADEMQTHESFNFALFDETADADVSWWVRDEYVGTELEAALDEFVPAWIERDWPLTSPCFDQF